MCTQRPQPLPYHHTTHAPHHNNSERGQKQKHSAAIVGAHSPPPTTTTYIAVTSSTSITRGAPGSSSWSWSTVSRGDRAGNPTREEKKMRERGERREPVTPGKYRKIERSLGRVGVIFREPLVWSAQGCRHLMQQTYIYIYINPCCFFWRGGVGSRCSEVSNARVEGDASTGCGGGGVVGWSSLCGGEMAHTQALPSCSTQKVWASPNAN